MKFHFLLQSLPDTGTAQVYSVHLDEDRARRQVSTIRGNPTQQPSHVNARYFVAAVEAEEVDPVVPQSTDQLQPAKVENKMHGAPGQEVLESPTASPESARAPAKEPQPHRKHF